MSSSNQRPRLPSNLTLKPHTVRADFPEVQPWLYGPDSQLEKKKSKYTVDANESHVLLSTHLAWWALAGSEGKDGEPLPHYFELVFEPSVFEADCQADVIERFWRVMRQVNWNANDVSLFLEASKSRKPSALSGFSDQVFRRRVFVVRELGGPFGSFFIKVARRRLALLSLVVQGFGGVNLNPCEGCEESWRSTFSASDQVNVMYPYFQCVSLPGHADCANCTYKENKCSFRDGPPEFVWSPQKGYRRPRSKLVFRDPIRDPGEHPLLHQDELDNPLDPIFSPRSSSHYHCPISKLAELARKQWPDRDPTAAPNFRSCVFANNQLIMDEIKENAPDDWAEISRRMK
ncbi:hypothetical protein ACHAQA_009854 [Verticillium albo-atrum]